jgi:transposase InsO family protein
VTLALVDDAVRSGAHLERACEVLGIHVRTVQRWRVAGVGEDRRVGPRHRPRNALSVAERRRVLAIANSERFRDKSPKQIVPALADEGKYVASESTMYRLLRAEGQLAHRGRAKPRANKRPKEQVATAANQVWSWDITYLRSRVRGQFFYLYLVLDVWSRKIIGWTVRDDESMEAAARLIEHACRVEDVDARRLVLHSDNGGPMKGSTMLATLQRLGIVPSFSRPRVADDNPYSEALFRTVKYCPQYPGRPFESVAEAKAWVASFVAWYNGAHRHSAIRFVTPMQRHAGMERLVLARRARVYEQARRRHPERWTRGTRNWTPIGAVRLNSPTETTSDLTRAA